MKAQTNLNFYIFSIFQFLHIPPQIPEFGCFKFLTFINFNYFFLKAYVATYVAKQGGTWESAKHHFFFLKLKWQTSQYSSAKENHRHSEDNLHIIKKHIG